MKQNLVPTMVTLTAGAVFGIAFMLSCGDNSPHSADADTCDCPAAEPPFAGRYTTRSTGSIGPIAIAPGAVSRSASIACPEGALVLGGSCTGTNPNSIPEDLVVVESGFHVIPPALPRGWGCTFKNTGTMPIDAQATVICLTPGS